MDKSHFIRFVQASTNLASTSNDNSTPPDSQKTDDDGISSAEFYKSLISEDSTTSNTSKRLPKRKIAVNRAKKHVKKPKHEIRRSGNSLTDRDRRLWFKAAANNDIRRLEELYGQGMAPDDVDMFGFTALACAAAAGSAEAVEYLLGELNADPDIRTKNGFTPAQLAHRNGHFGIVRFISESRSKCPNSSSTPHQSSENPTFCPSCRQSVPTLDSHLTSIHHVIKTGAVPCPGFAYGISSSNVGYRLLRSAGWHESQGLGSDGSGRKYPIKTVLKRDRACIGTAEHQKSVPRVTHFTPGDLDAVKQKPQPSKKSYFGQLEARKKKDRAIETEIRQALNGFD